MQEASDEKYMQIVIEPIRLSAQYRPKFGRGGRSAGLSIDEFQNLYQGDSFYSWLGLDNALIYAAHKAAGGITSVYRQIGIGCERLFREVLKDKLELTDEGVKWSYQVPASNGRVRKFHLDGRVVLADIRNVDARERFHEWMKRSAESVNVDPDVFATLKGAVFEVRQGYKSKDSKRQRADIANAAIAYTKAYLPCAVVFSEQIDADIVLRYRAEKWSIITGSTSEKSDPLSSTYSFFRDVIGYDLAAFFERNRETFREEVRTVLKTLLEPS